MIHAKINFDARAHMLLPDFGIRKTLQKNMKTMGNKFVLMFHKCAKFHDEIKFVVLWMEKNNAYFGICLLPQISTDFVFCTQHNVISPRKFTYI